jgi:hypothetical protein
MANGQGFTSEQGAVVLGLTLALVGSSIAVESGTITGGQHGQVVTISQGTLTPVQGVTVPLVGEASTSATGTLAPRNEMSALDGPAISSAAGTITAEGNAVTVNIGGEESTFFFGLVGSAQYLMGSASVASQGSAVASLTLPISGEVSACSAGFLAAAQDAVDTRIDSGQGSAVGAFSLALTGTSLTGSQGTLTPTGDITLGLTGEASTASAGTIGIEESYQITGSAITSASQTMGAPGRADLVGAESVVSAGEIHTDDDRTYALVGQSITVADGSAVTSYIAFFTPQTIAVGQQEIGPRAAALSGAAVAVSAGVMSPPVVEVVSAGGGGGGKPPKKPHKPKRHPAEEDPLVHKHTGTLEHGSASRIRGEAIEKIAENLERKKKPDDDEDEALLLL